MRLLLLAAAIALFPSAALADPVSLIGIVALAAGGSLSTAIAGSAAVIGVLGATGAAVLGGVIGGVISLAGALIQQALSPTGGTTGQNKTRGRDFDPHPPFRFAFGEFPQKGSVVWHQSRGGIYYYVILLNSLPSEEITSIEVNDGVTLTFDDLENAYDFTGDGARATGPYPWSQYDGTGAYLTVWIGRGDQTGPPDRFNNNWKGGTGSFNPLDSTDIWSGATVAFVRQVWSKSRSAKQITHGKPSPLLFHGKWSKLYDPRKDPTSGVTQYGSTSPTPTAHDRDDVTTWEYSPNPALAALTLARHQYALGFDDEMIPIQQWADAADACGEGVASSSQIIDLNALVNVGADHASGVAAGVTVSGFNANDILELTLPTGQTYTAWSPWGTPAYSGPATGSLNYFEVAVDGDASNTLSQSVDHPTNANGAWDGYEAARAAFGTKYITGGESYTFYVIDDPAADNSGGLSIQIVSTGNPRFRCDGLVLVREREMSMLDPVLDCMAGFIDPTDGLIGVRAGVWETPTETLSQPLEADIELSGARDAGFDLVRAKYISVDRDWQETDGPGYRLRSGFREKPLELPLVREPQQAAQLEAIVAKTAEPNRTLTATWGGKEFTRRVGDRVSASLPGFDRAASTYRIISKAPVVEAAEDGLRVDVRMTLVEDVAANYTLDVSDFSAQEVIAVDDETVAQLEAPASITLEQSDYNSGGAAAARIKITVTISDDLSLAAQSLTLEYSDGGGFLALSSQSVTEEVTSYVLYMDPVLVSLTYTIRVNAVSDTGEVSDWTTSSPLTVQAPVLDYDVDDYSVEYG